MLESITEKKEWKAAIELSEHHDFYHTFSYHRLSKKEDESPMLIRYTERTVTILLPLLIRPIVGTPYSDATSVYGYVGPLCWGNVNDFDNRDFRRELESFFKQQKIVTVFSRLHPYIDYQETILEGMGGITYLNDVVNIDLTQSLEVQRAAYSSRLKTYLNKTRSTCTVFQGYTEDDINGFIEIYYDNMRRVNAHINYFFDKSYFYHLLLSSDFETELLLCKLNETDEVIAGIIFIKTDDIVQYHLSGAKTEFIKHGAIKLIIDEMRLRATEQQFRYFNLGGGKGSNDDSLFAFKASFSKNLKPFKLWKYVANTAVYKELIETEQQRAKKSLTEEELNYFPAYRILQQMPQE